MKVTTGRAALRNILLQDFSLVVMDIHLSDMSGIDVASLIRLRPRSVNTPIIFTSVFSEEEFMTRYKLAPRNLAFMSKPVDPEKFIAQVLFFIK